jgi:cytochrome b561
MPHDTRYTRIAVTLHWLVALLMIVNVALGIAADELPDDWVRPVIDTHKSIGITVLGLVLLRLLWRAGHPPPPLPIRYARWERIASHAVHGLLYASMLALPLSGWLHDSAWKDAATHPMQLFGLFEWPRIGLVSRIEPVAKEALHTTLGIWHTGLGYALYGLLALHLAGALKHQFIDGERELQRMSLK